MDEVWKKYKIIIGKHVMRCQDGVSRTFVAGDVFLARPSVMNRIQPPGVPQEKFIPVDDNTPLRGGFTKEQRLQAITGVSEQPAVSPSPKFSTEQLAELRKEYEGLTVDQLKGLASDEELDTAGLKKADLIELLIKHANA